MSGRIDFSPVLGILNAAEARLHHVDSPRLSAELLVASALGCSRLDLVLNRHRQLTAAETASIEALLARREAGEPVAYILGEKEFYGLDFQVTPATLIPRPETEHIIEEAEAVFPKNASFRFADLGTGSGILAVTLCVLFPLAQGVAVDISPEALRVAERNSIHHNVADQLSLQCGDMTARLFDHTSLDLIVSNPPYVTEAEFAAASNEVTCFEPTGALVSGADGLRHIRAMVPHVADALVSGGLFLMEVGYTQGEAVTQLFAQKPGEFREIRIIKDLAGLDRIVSARKL